LSLSKEITLIVAHKRKPADTAAIRLVQRHFGHVRIIERRTPSKDEPLPVLWTSDNDYAGLRRIRYFVRSNAREASVAVG
jgi:hypothetical protein